VSVRPTIILATSNGIGMGHLVRACAVAKALLPEAEPIIVSMAPGIADVGAALGIRPWARSRMDAASSLGSLLTRSFDRFD